MGADVSTQRLRHAPPPPALFPKTRVLPFRVMKNAAHLKSLKLAPAGSSPHEFVHGKPNSDVVRPWVGAADILRTPSAGWIIDFPPAWMNAKPSSTPGRSRICAGGRNPSGRRAARRGGSTAHRRPKCASRSPSVTASSLFRGSPNTSSSSGCRRKPCPTASSSSSPATTIGFSACCTRVFTKSGRCAWELSSTRRRPAFATRRTRASRRSPSLGRRPRPSESSPAHRRISAPPSPQAARALDAQRREWLGDRSDPQRTLTALYNARPAWLQRAHASLDDAVAAAYGWPADLSDDEMIARLRALNQERSSRP